MHGEAALGRRLSTARWPTARSRSAERRRGFLRDASRPWAGLPPPSAAPGAAGPHHSRGEALRAHDEAAPPRRARPEKGRHGVAKATQSREVRAGEATRETKLPGGLAPPERSPRGSAEKVEGLVLPLVKGVHDLDRQRLTEDRKVVCVEAKLRLHDVKLDFLPSQVKSTSASGEETTRRTACPPLRLGTELAEPCVSSVAAL